jgi:hypothetical protein
VPLAVIVTDATADIELFASAAAEMVIDPPEGGFAGAV